MGIEKILQGSGLFHKGIHFLGGGFTHQTIDFVHTGFHFVEEIEGRGKDIADGHAFCQDSVLVEVADANVPGPFDLALVRHEFSGDDIHEGGFSFAVGTDKTDVFAF